MNHMPYKKTIQHFIIATSLLLAFRATAQNFVLPDGEYMDTASNPNPKCKNNIYYFYSVGGKYPKSSSTVLKEVQTFLLQKNEQYPGSGYITFRFIIDCEGRLMPGIQVLQTDQQYSVYHFSKNLVNELFAFLKTLDQWKIAKSKEGETFSYKAFITFKIKNGKVINIIP